jgi:hypothetical protein
MSSALMHWPPIQLEEQDMLCATIVSQPHFVAQHKVLFWHVARAALASVSFTWIEQFSHLDTPAYSAAKQLEQLSIRLSRQSVATMHESFVSLLSLWYATCINSYGYEQSLRVPAVDRITKEKERENTDGPDIARPTGKHGAPDWFLA